MAEGIAAWYCFHVDAEHAEPADFITVHARLSLLPHKLLFSPSQKRHPHRGTGHAGVPEVPRMDPTSSKIPPSRPVLDNPSSCAVHAVLDLAQSERGTWLAPCIARLHSPKFMHYPIAQQPAMRYDPAWLRQLGAAE